MKLMLKDDYESSGASWDSQNEDDSIKQQAKKLETIEVKKNDLGENHKYYNKDLA